MMHRWLPTGMHAARQGSTAHAAACPVPPFATHHVGAGGVVVNERDELLVVQEAHKNTGWKFPGGLADLAEGVADTAVREVCGWHPQPLVITRSVVSVLALARALWRTCAYPLTLRVS